MCGWRSGSRRRGSSPRAEQCSRCSRSATRTRSKPGCCAARDRAHGGCAIWRRRSPSASRRASRACVSSSNGGRSTSICAASAFRRPGAGRGSWRRFRRWAWRAPSPLRSPTATMLRRLRNFRPRSRPARRRRIHASCGRLTKRAVLARPIPCWPRRWAPTRRTAASRSRPCSAAPNSKAATSSSAPLPGDRRSPRSSSAGLFRAWTAAAWSRFRLRRCSGASGNSWAIAVLACWARNSTSSRRLRRRVNPLKRRRPNKRACRPTTSFRSRPKRPPAARNRWKWISRLPRRRLPKLCPHRTPPSRRTEASRLTEPPDAGETEGLEPAPAERTAEIYVLRQLALPPASNIVPIRPGALDGLSSREPLHGLPTESVELTRSERDAFREIARALIGRPPAARGESAGERAELGIAGPADAPEVGRASTPRQGAPATRRFGATPAPFSTVCRSAFWSPATRARSTSTGRCSISSAIAISRNSRRRTGSPAMFRDRDPQRMAADDAGSVEIVRADGQVLSVDGHAQAIGWDGAPATLIALRRSPEVELQARLGAAERDGADAQRFGQRPSGDARPGDRRRGHARRRRPHPLLERAGASGCSATTRTRSPARAS